MSNSPPSSTPPAPTAALSGASWMGWLGAVWGLSGVVLLLLSAVWRLSPIAWDALTGPLSTVQAGFAGFWVLFMAYTEGYKGFQKAFSPRVVVRATWLRDHPKPWLVLLAPLFCMGMVHATRKRMMVSWILMVVIVGFVIAVKLLPAPWRGLVDAGVVVGLTWGLAAMAASLWQTFRGRPPVVPADVPA